MFNSIQTVRRFAFVTVALAGLLAPATQADVVQATYAIASSDFRNSNDDSPTAPTSNAVDGIYTVTFNSAFATQNDLMPDAVSGLDITNNDGATFDYDETNSGLNTRRFAQTNELRLTIGGTVSTVAWMVGLSDDFRVTFNVSLSDYSVTSIHENLSFVTPADAFYTAENTTVTLLDATIMPDTDNDLLIDTMDNCIEVANTDQRDTDADGIGNRCDADFNQDCIVNVLDLGQMRIDFFASGDLDTDLDGNGSVNVTDLGILRSLFFQEPGPSGVSSLCSP